MSNLKSKQLENKIDDMLIIQKQINKSVNKINLRISKMEENFEKELVKLINLEIDKSFEERFTKDFDKNFDERIYKHQAKVNRLMKTNNKGSMLHKESSISSYATK
jgi:ribosomal protein S17E